MKKEKNSTNRAIVAGIGFIIQIAWILMGVYQLNKNYPALDITLRIMAILLVFRILGKHTNSAIKIPWIIGLLVAPVAGLILYVLLGSRFTSIFIRRRFKSIYGMSDGVLLVDRDLMNKFKNYDPQAYGHINYIEKYGRYPAYDNNKVVYYPDASEAIEVLKVELEKAEKFIFMEYHAIEDSVSFQAIEDILKKKVKEGLDIRIIYDDVGSIGFVNRPFSKRLNSEGIKCRVFNPVMPIVNIFMNNRDHRKITVIDGKVGFTGGYNIADEYFNIVNPYGYWKDTGIMIKGRSVDNLTMIFLEMWHAMDSTRKAKENLSQLINQYDMEELISEQDKGTGVDTQANEMKQCDKDSENSMSDIGNGKKLKLLQPFEIGRASCR